MLDFEEDKRDVTQIPEEGLSIVSALARRQVELENQLTNLVELQKIAAEELRGVQEVRLPEAMAALGLEELTLKDGSKISVGIFFHAQIPKAQEGKAFAWLKEHGMDSMIKNEVTAVFGKGEDELAVAFIKMLDENSYQYKSKKAVHPQTLKAFVKEQHEAGTPVPDTVFGVHIQTKALISR